jgi:uncharacterized delta-60 repeat protein
VIKRTSLLLVSALLFYGSICFSCHVVNPCEPPVFPVNPCDPPIIEVDPIVISIPNGKLNPTFGSGGAVVTELNFPGGSQNHINAIGFQLTNTGRLVMTGTAGNVPSTLIVAGFRPTGILDTSFNPPIGYNISPVPRTVAKALAINTNQEIVITGNAIVSPFDRPFLLVFKYTPIGTGPEDNVLAINGKEIIDRSSIPAGTIFQNIIGNACASQKSNNRIVVAGYYTIAGKNHNLIAKLTNEVKFDPTFATDGIQAEFMIPGSSSSQINGVTIQDDGKIVVVGMAVINGRERAFVARLNANGSLDFSFNHPFGYKLLDWDGNASANAVVIKPATPEKIVIVGQSTLHGITSAVYQILNYSDGSNLVGPVFISPSTNVKTLEFNAIATDPTAASISYITGTQTLNSGKKNFFCSRLIGNAIDTSFSPTGYVTIDFIGYNAIANGVTVRPDGSPVIGGYVQRDNDTLYAMACLRP